MIQIKRAENKDKDEIKKLVLTVLEEFHMSGLKTKTEDLANLERYYFSRRGTFLIAVDGEKIVGTVAVENFESKAPNTALLRRFYVDKGYRRQGIGKRLMEEIIKEAKILGYKKIVLGSEHEFKDAHKAYLAAGFTEYKRDEISVYFEKDI